MALPQSFFDEVRARVRLSDLVARRVKLIRRGHEFTGLCPFHQEKTPSFTVADDKGFYHCFGCQAHGDVFKWVMETQGVSFIEAAQELAEQAGVAMPRPTREEEERERRRASLLEICEMAASFFEEQLKSHAGAAAREYLSGRALDAAHAPFRLGYAPGTGGALVEHLKRKGVEPAQMLEAGLAFQPEGGGAVRDFFRKRIVFPIADTRGRVVAFGARALDGGEKAKYINSPDTPLFKKGALLYNFDKARKAAFERREIVVAEGYVDVIALALAGFPHAVAPLGTALTEAQLEALWRVAPEPTLCFDGDAAGVRAAHRALDRALPMLKPGQSLRFAFLPQGQDPDELIRAAGAEAMARVIAAAQPLADVLWAREAAGADISTPERAAKLEARLDALVRSVEEPTVREHYRRDVRARLQRLLGIQPRDARSFRPRAKPVFARRDVPAYRAAAGLPDAALAQDQLASQARRGLSAAGKSREQALLLALVNHPFLIEKHYGAIEALAFEDKDHAALAGALLEAAAEGKTLDKAMISDHLARRGLAALTEKLLLRRALRALKFLWPEAEAREAEDGFLHTLARHRKVAILVGELREARGAWAADPTAEKLARMRDIELRLNSAEGEETAFAGRKSSL